MTPGARLSAAIEVLADIEDRRRPAADALRDDAPAHVRGDYPEWLDPYFAAVFGEQRADEGAALSRRAPVDLRANTLKADRATALAALAHLGATPTPWSPVGLRIA